MDQNPTGLFALRPATLADADAITDMINACSVERTGTPRTTIQQVRGIMQTPGLDLATDLLVAIGRHGQLVALALVQDCAPHTSFSVLVDVHPDHRGQGIGATLCRWTEARSALDEQGACRGAGRSPATAAEHRRSRSGTAGFCLSNPREAGDPETAWIDVVGVRPSWRRWGLALSLLHHSFGSLYRHGRRRIALEVDTQNATGATRLYEKAGMHAERQYDFFEKELLPADRRG